MIELIKMSNLEYDLFNELCIDELIIAFYSELPDNEARSTAEREQSRLLPDGLETVDHYFFSIKKDTKNIGGIWFSKLCRKEKDIAFVYYVTVSRNFRGNGFGTKAMLSLEEHVKKVGLDTVRLHVLKDNIPAIKLYNKLGYHIYTDYQGFNSNDPGNIMEKTVVNNSSKET